MVEKRWKITNVTHGTIELGGTRGLLGVGCSTFILNDVPDNLKFLHGARLIKIEEVPLKPTKSTPTQSEIRSESQEPTQRNRERK